MLCRLPANCCWSGRILLQRMDSALRDVPLRGGRRLLTPHALPHRRPHPHSLLRRHFSFSEWYLQAAV